MGHPVLNIIKKTIIYGFFNSTSALIPFLLLPVLTHYLSSEDYGIITIINIFILFLSTIFRCELQAALKREYMEHKNDFGGYVGTSLIIPIFILALLISFFMPFYLFASDKIYGIPTLWIFVCLIIAFANGVSAYLLALYQIKDQAISAGLWALLTAVPIFLGTFFLVTFFDFNWQGRILPSLITAIFIQIPLSFYLIYRIVPYKITFDLKKTIELLRFSLPLIPMTIAIYILLAADRIFITKMIDLETAGIYAVSAQLAAIMMLVYNSFLPTWEAFIFEKLKENKKGVYKNVSVIFIFFVFVMFLIALFVIFIFPYIMPYLLGKEFCGSMEYLPWLVSAVAMRGILYALFPFISYIRKTKIIMYLNFFLVLLYGLLNYMLILLHGAVGAAQANLIIYIVGFCILLFYIVLEYRKLLLTVKDAKYPADSVDYNAQL